MTIDNSLWSYFTQSSVVVQLVLFLLLAASILSWTLIIQRGWFLKKAKAALLKFEDQFWSGIPLGALYNKCQNNPDDYNGLQSIFRSGFKEFLAIHKRLGNQNNLALQGTERAIRVAMTRSVSKLEQSLAVLATIGSTSPYVGLFGTVWGIMTVFHSLGSVQQATISMVAPGISEALIATAMGLFAAIPAVVAYNRYADQVERLENQYAAFGEEMIAVLQKQDPEALAVENEAL